MSFACTVGSLVTKLVTKLALADQISLNQLWEAALEHTYTPELDSFQKNVIWRALMTNPGVPLLQIFAREERVEVSPDLTFGALLSIASEADINLKPTEDCQFRYLTNTDDFLVLKTQLGELPFGLLIVIARHGEAGILNADLAKESGQDIRSIRLRLQKLEAAQLIVLKNVYVNKKHTTLSVHVKFAPEPVRSKDIVDEEESIVVTRDVKRLRILIVTALKNAPNQLRGFSDLLKELNLDASRSTKKFFRSVCFNLHRSGHIEKLHVELPETQQRVYALKYVKDVSSNLEDPQDLAVADSNEKDGFDDSDLDDDETTSTPSFPVWNHIFSPFHQIYAQVENSGTQGITSGEICKNLLGSSEYRPYTRLFEVLPTYLSNSENLKPFKKYTEPYDEHSVTRLYDNEGKLRFYKYFATSFCTEKKPTPKPYKFVVKPSNLTMKQLSSKFSGPANPKNRVSRKALWEKKRRLFENCDTACSSPSPLKKQKVVKAKKKKQPIIEDHDDEDMADTSVREDIYDLSAIDVALAAQERSSRVRKAAPKSFVGGDLAIEVDTDLGEEYTPKVESEEDDDLQISEEDIQAALRDNTGPPSIAHATRISPNSPKSGSANTISATDLPTFVSIPSKPDKKRIYPTAVKSGESLKSITRREHLLAIIRENGGGVFKTVSVCRELDERLGAKTATDTRTLGRDLEYLISTGVLMTQNVLIKEENKSYEAPVFVFVNAAERPSNEQMERIKQHYAMRSIQKKKYSPKRVIQSDLILYVEKRKEKPLKRKRGKGRLATLGEDANVEPSPARDEAAESKDPVPELDMLSKIKSNKRPRKAVTVSTRSFGPKRPRRNIKLEKSDSTTLYRSVVISKAFSRDAIDFDAIAELLNDIDGQLLRQKWGTLRRSFGGANAVSKGVQTFQNMVMQGIDDGVVTEQDLLDGDLEFFLEFWRRFDTCTEFSVADEMPLYASFQKNSSSYKFAPVNLDTTTGLLEKIDDQSMRQKEYTLSRSHFHWESNQLPSSQPLDKEKSVLKSIFATGEENFDKQIFETVLGKFNEKDIRKATDALTSARVVSFLAFENTEKFVLGERFKATLVSKPLSSKLLRQAAAFKETLTDISTAQKALFVSQAVQTGDMISLLELISEDILYITRVDRPFRFENYESRLVGKDQIACDIIVRVDPQKARDIQPTPVAAPLKGPCEPMWVDVSANFNKDLWMKIILAIISYVVFRPGTTDYLVHERMSAVLTYADYCSAIGWLMDTGCLKQTYFGGYVATNKWQYILGF